MSDPALLKALNLILSKLDGLLMGQVGIVVEIKKVKDKVKKKK